MKFPFGPRRRPETPTPTPAPGGPPPPTPGPAPAPPTGAGAWIRAEDYVGADADKNEQTVRRQFIVKAKKYIRYLPLAEETVAMYYCMLDPKTPTWVKVTAGAALAYFILPIDAIPDVLPLVGLGDDASVLAGALTAISAYVTNDHRAQARLWLEAEAPASSGTAKP